jgi:hypothetical protein
MNLVNWTKAEECYRYCLEHEEKSPEVYCALEQVSSDKNALMKQCTIIKSLLN